MLCEWIVQAQCAPPGIIANAWYLWPLLACLSPALHFGLLMEAACAGWLETVMNVAETVRLAIAVAHNSIFFIGVSHL